MRPFIANGDTTESTTGANSFPRPGAPSWIGRVGRAATALRPSGTAWLDGERVDVVTEGEFVSAGTTVQVIKHEGSRVVVRRADGPHDQGGLARASES